MDTDLLEKSEFDLHVAKKFVQIQQSAESRGLDFAMTLTEVKKLLKQKKCFFTEVTLTSKLNDPYMRTFDRIDNTIGYVDGNVVACTKEFNEIKGNLTIDQIRLLVRGLKKKKLW